MIEIHFKDKGNKDKGKGGKNYEEGGKGGKHYEEGKDNKGVEKIF